MLRRDLGLTKLYNRVNAPGIADSDDRDIARLRQIHVELDRVVMAAYDWDEVPSTTASTPTARWSAGR